jgi:hypothetical protein
MTQMNYIVGERKLDRIHHRLLAKKRNWLVRQIDPAKRYLFMIKKQAKMANQEVMTDSSSCSDCDESE